MVFRGSVVKAKFVMLQQNTVPPVASNLVDSSAASFIGASASESALFAAVAAVTIAAEAAVNAASVASTASLLCTEACASVHASGAYAEEKKAAQNPTMQARSVLFTPQATISETTPQLMQPQEISAASAVSLVVAAPPEKEAERNNTFDELPVLLPDETTSTSPQPPRSSRRQKRRQETVVTGEAIPINTIGAPRWEGNPNAQSFGGKNKGVWVSNNSFDDATVFDIMYDIPNRREPEPENRLKLIAFLLVLIFAIVTLAVLLIRA